MTTTCPKCNYTRQPSDTAPDYECPKCGVIYQKYLEAQRAQRAEAPARPATSAQPTQPAQARKAIAAPVQTAPDLDDDIEAFTDRLRADSRYPTFRELVKIITYFWMALAALIALGGVVSLIKVGGFAGFGILLTSLFFAALFVVVGRISREVSLMLVDLSDAAVRIASRMQP
ncbi:MAG: hypothetical protein AzoDbin1_03890 [Azoarcus sp.]|nr:hypothetical protein [Azoarcus sp.]